MYKILIADDVKEMRDLLAQVIDSMDYEYFEAANGTKVIEVVKENPHIHLALVDIEMPQLSGIEAVQKIKEINPDIKICFISGSKDKNTVANAIKAGGNDYVVKPIDIMILMQKIKKLLGADAGSEFAVIETSVQASIQNFPIECPMRVTSLSEVGLSIACPMALKVGERIPLLIPKLDAIFGKNQVYSCQIDTIEQNKETGEFITQCSFYGLHENQRSEIRGLTTKGQKITDDA